MIESFISAGDIVAKFHLPVSPTLSWKKRGGVSTTSQILEPLFNLSCRSSTTELVSQLQVNPTSFHSNYRLQYGLST